MRFPVENYHHVGGANHFDLLNHPAIYEQIKRWVSGRPALEPGVAGELSAGGAFGGDARRA